jgi:hypothetical protein
VDQTVEKIGQAAADAGNVVEDTCEEVKENVNTEKSDCQAMSNRTSRNATRSTTERNRS